MKRITLIAVLVCIISASCDNTSKTEATSGDSTTVLTEYGVTDATANAPGDDTIKQGTVSRDISDTGTNSRD